MSVRFSNDKSNWLFNRLMNLEEQYRKEKEEADLLFEQQRQVCISSVLILQVGGCGFA